MKSLKRHIVAMTLVASILCGVVFVPASYSQFTTMAVDIPFAFYVGDKEMPAGTYKVKPLSANNWVMLITDDREHSTFVGTMPEQNGELSLNRLVFNRYGSVYFLSRLEWAGTERSHTLIKSGYERELLATNPSVGVSVATR